MGWRPIGSKTMGGGALGQRWREVKKMGGGGAFGRWRFWVVVRRAGDNVVMAREGRPARMSAKNKWWRGRRRGVGVGSMM